MGEHVIIYGAGNCLKKYYKYFYENYNVDAIIDKTKQGNFNGVPIYGLEYLNKNLVQKIIIMIENRDICMSVADAISDEYEIPKENIEIGLNLIKRCDSDNPFKIGIMGCGSMASQMALAVLNMCHDIKIQACASRNQRKADEFAFKYGIEKAYGSYVDMLKNDEMDLVYIATPISEHYSNMKQCIEYGKNILCEKTFTINEMQTIEIFELAKKKSLYVSEAMTIRYNPLFARLKDILVSGSIGEILNIHASFNYKIDALERIKNLDLGGGALLELGVYNLNFMTICLGYDIANIISHCCKFETGADASTLLTVHYSNGKTAELYCDSRCSGNNQGIVYGEKGFIIIDEINRPTKLVVYDNNRRVVEEYHSKMKELGLENEIMVAKKTIEENGLECSECSHEHTISIMQIMDRIRRQIALKYPMEV